MLCFLDKILKLPGPGSTSVCWISPLYRKDRPFQRPGLHRTFKFKILPFFSRKAAKIAKKKILISYPLNMQRESKILLGGFGWVEGFPGKFCWRVGYETINKSIKIKISIMSRIPTRIGIMPPDSRKYGIYFAILIGQYRFLN